MQGALHDPQLPPATGYWEIEIFRVLSKYIFDDAARLAFEKNNPARELREAEIVSSFVVPDELATEVNEVVAQHFTAESVDERFFHNIQITPDMARELSEILSISIPIDEYEASIQMWARAEIDSHDDISTSNMPVTNPLINPES